MSQGFARSGLSGEGRYIHSSCTLCGERRGTCHNSVQLLHLWEVDHRKTCFSPAAPPAPPCNNPGCLHCNP